MKKTKWKKPELTVLVRNKPEEAVLAYCKVMDDMGPGEWEYYYCDIEAGYGTPCLEAHPS